ncbi:MAG: hypothetical protein HXS48_16985 [Theionarchaea archaeon]|nr:hypothetical protein [Theionarchaea archaeon]
MSIEYLFLGLTAFATIYIAFVTFRKFRQSNKEKRKDIRLKVLRFLYLYQKRIRGAISMIPRGEFNRWDLEDDIKQRYTVEFYSLPKNVQTELRKVSTEYKELEEKQRQQRKKNPGKMKDSLENLEKIIEKEIDSLASKLQLNQV